MTTITLRNPQPSDLEIFFTHQLDAEACYMAAFTAKDPTDRVAFDTHWQRILNNPKVRNQTIVLHDQTQGTEEVVGHIASFEQFGDREITYWLGREHWGKGIATRALMAFLADEPTRPLHARAAKDNHASVRVLQKCGFVITGEDRGFANARNAEIEEFILQLAVPE